MNLSFSQSSTGQLFKLSEHARERLAERFRVPESTLLSMLEGNYSKVIHRAWLPSPNVFRRHHGLRKFKHRLIWSEVDNRPLTAICRCQADGSEEVATVLFADADFGWDWSDKVTPAAFEVAKNKSREWSSRAAAGGGERLFLVVQWLEGQDGVPFRQSINLRTSLLNEDLFTRAVHLALETASGGWGVRAYIRTRKTRKIVWEKGF